MSHRQRCFSKWTCLILVNTWQGLQTEFYRHTLRKCRSTLHRVQSSDLFWVKEYLLCTILIPIFSWQGHTQIDQRSSRLTSFDNLRKSKAYRWKLFLWHLILALAVYLIKAFVPTNSGRLSNDTNHSYGRRHLFLQTGKYFLESKRTRDRFWLWNCTH